MIRTRSQLENLWKDELIDEHLSLENLENDTISMFLELKIAFNFLYERVSSNDKNTTPELYIN